MGCARFMCTMTGVALLALAAAVTAAPAAAPGTTALEIVEVGVGSRSFVALRNFTDRPVSLRGLYLCEAKRCAALPDAAVESRATARIASGTGKGLKNVVARGASFGRLPPANGEVALFASRSIRNRRTIRGYLQWGSTPHTFTKVAIASGIWVKGAYAPSAPDAVRLYRKKSGLWVFESR